MAKLSNRIMGPVLLAVACVTLGSATPSIAQPIPQDWRPGDAWNRDIFWRGAPNGIRERVDWLQQRIDRGVADGSLDQREADRAQRELDGIKRDAMALDERLDDASRNISWSRRDTGYYDGGPRRDDPYATDYDASRYYRDGPSYRERRLGANDEVYRGSDGRYYCKRNDGTTGLVIGGIGGAVAGNVIDGGRNRVAGTLIGGALGALIGKSVDQNNSDIRCR
ncbi:17 kda surface antigen family protein [Novosphingobium sp. Rr 2-17]|uniref:glycine zipper 2TM domain-containing protein n=1 Tax=Novosphingobium sp. Rr 2-17 TaxID=555793 RepID=UPI000269923D|nr:glycine zipper 2TM domain-containing protein [Novosphingobium sp. Rr 2-17]EIZ78035.1 17 kda surface antigen family protein [Novosphingobium sp. Rr 2-17]